MSLTLATALWTPGSRETRDGLAGRKRDSGELGKGSVGLGDSPFPPYFVLSPSLSSTAS